MKTTIRDAIIKNCSVVGLDNGGDGEPDLWQFNTSQLLKIESALKQWFLENVIGEDEVFVDIPIVDHTGKVTNTINGNSYTPYMLAKNQLRSEMRAKLTASQPRGDSENE